MLEFGLKKHKAFTLAEVLITLGIIGVVASMTLPTLINRTRNKELQTAFKKTYSELGQIAMHFKADNDISISEYAASVPLRKSVPEIMKYYSGNKKISNTSLGHLNPDTHNYEPIYAMNSLNGAAFSGGKNNGGSDSSFLCDDSSIYINSRGAIILFNNKPEDRENGPVVCVDVNGKKGPNRFGVDYFLFIFTLDGSVIPMGQDHPTNTDYVCNSKSGDCGNFSNEGAAYCQISAKNYTKNASCAYYALMNEHPTQRGKDYWQDFLGAVYRR